MLNVSVETFMTVKFVTKKQN